MSSSPQQTAHETDALELAAVANDVDREEARYVEEEDLALADSDDDQGVGDYKPPARARRMDALKRKGRHYLELIKTAMSKQGGNTIHIRIDNRSTPEPLPPQQQQAPASEPEPWEWEMSQAWTNLMCFFLGMFSTFLLMVIVFMAVPFKEGQTWCDPPTAMPPLLLSSSSSSAAGYA